MDDKAIANNAAINLKLVHKLGDYSKNKKGELADIINEAAKRLEEMTVIMLQLSDEVRKYERKEIDTDISNK